MKQAKKVGTGESTSGRNLDTNTSDTTTIQDVMEQEHPFSKEAKAAAKTNHIMTANRLVKGEIYDTLREALLKPKTPKSKVTWAEAFVNEMLTKAINDPNSQMARILAQSIIKEDILSDLDAQTERLLARDREFIEYRVLKQCYKEQQEVLSNVSDRYLLVNTSRRTGKTNLAARWLVKKCIIPNSETVYIHLKFSNAIDQCFDLCVEAANKAELAIERQSKSEGVICFVNGSYIKFMGNNNKAEADKLRGFKYRGVVIEEFAFTPNQKYLVEDVLTPTLADYPDSQILGISTPPRAPKTYYEECYRSGKWKVYEWNATANPFINFADFIKETLETKGLSEDSPFVQRELFGKFAYDTEAQVFNGYQTYTLERPDEQPFEVCKRLGMKVTNVYIGEDYGFKDYNAIIGVAVDVDKKKALVYAERKFNNSTVTDIVRATQEVFNQGTQLLVEFNANMSNIGIYGDTSDKSIIYELSQTHHLPAFPCYKYDKANAIAQLADYCRLGNVVVPANGILQDEFERTLYKRDDQDVILPEIDDETFHPDAVMALLYASRQIHQEWS